MCHVITYAKVYVLLFSIFPPMTILSPEKFTRRKLLSHTLAIGMLGISGCATKSDSTPLPSTSRSSTLPDTNTNSNTNSPTSDSGAPIPPKKESTPKKVCSPVTPIPKIQKSTPPSPRKLPFTDGTSTISTNTMDVDQAILDLINKRRKAYGHHPLKLDKRLSEVGREHSLLMANEKLISDPKTSHFKSTTISVPLYLPLGKHPRTHKITSSSAESSSKAAFDELMHSEETQKTLLDPNMKYGAVGSVYTDRSYWITIYVVQVNPC